ncbi:uncharacterized protein LOC120071853 isoform X2 [Benincasa hispida]|uniref:uncharacterized protein LOC120071853 isoform X2 n=1 Tax=Benincasa hispida TaxID=102211 RepID=UPI001901A192|nr:uncharacterized protein LOC120071853 isoform X2 [Benincasa hispida]
MPFSRFRPSNSISSILHQRLRSNPKSIHSQYCSMDITEEQRRRAEANRLAAIAKRKALIKSSNGQQHQDPWELFKCRKLSTEHNAASTIQSSKSLTGNDTHLPERFRVRLEICSPDSFSITPEVVEGCFYPGEENCFRILSDCLSSVTHSHYTQIIGGGKALVYKLRDYCSILKCLKNSKDIDVEEIPWTTFNVVERLSHSFSSGRWMPCRPEHLSDEKRGGRCLIADEMGLGKTLQAIAIASCLMDEDGSILVVCPAVLRFSWAEELERWLPFCLPSDIHLGIVFLIGGSLYRTICLQRCDAILLSTFLLEDKGCS